MTAHIPGCRYGGQYPDDTRGPGYDDPPCCMCCGARCLHDDDTICEDCKSDGIAKCADCGDWTSEPETYRGHVLCHVCVGAWQAGEAEDAALASAQLRREVAAEIEADHV